MTVLFIVLFIILFLAVFCLYVAFFNIAKHLNKLEKEVTVLYLKGKV